MERDFKQAKTYDDDIGRLVGAILKREGCNVSAMAAEVGRGWPIGVLGRLSVRLIVDTQTRVAKEKRAVVSDRCESMPRIWFS